MKRLKEHKPMTFGKFIGSISPPAKTSKRSYTYKPVTKYVKQKGGTYKKVKTYKRIGGERKGKKPKPFGFEVNVPEFDIL